MSNDTGKRIRKLRLSLGLTQLQFAKKLRTTQSHLSALETGEYSDYKVSQIKRIARMFPDPKRTATYLLGEI